MPEARRIRVVSPLGPGLLSVLRGVEGLLESEFLDQRVVEVWQSSVDAPAEELLGSIRLPR
jgi:hypothetical protein